MQILMRSNFKKLTKPGLLFFMSFMATFHCSCRCLLNFLNYWSWVVSSSYFNYITLFPASSTFSSPTTWGTTSATWATASFARIIIWFCGEICVLYTGVGIYRATKITRKADFSVFRVYFIARASEFYSAIY